MDEEATTRPAAAARASRLIRPALLATVLVALWWAADRTGVRDSMSQEAIRDMAAGAGALGVVAYLAAFSGGVLIQLPGVLFVVAARIAYGPVLGYLAAYAGALLSVIVTFAVVRTIGGKPLAEIQWGPARRIMARLSERPVLTIALLRTFFVVSPPLNYALAMSRTRFREYVAGSALGLVLPIGVMVLAAECLVALAAYAL